MKRSDLLGGPNCVFNSSDNDEGNSANKANKASSEDDKDNTLRIVLIPTVKKPWQRRIVCNN
jgi:hypothetical protein